MPITPTNIRRNPCELTGDLLVALRKAHGPLSKRALCIAVGHHTNRASVQRYIDAWHDRGLLYVVKWDTCVRPRYALSPVLHTPDAPRPEKIHVYDGKQTEPSVENTSVDPPQT